jgi:hypothetical protein
MQKQKKQYEGIRLEEYGSLTEVVLDVCDGGSGDAGTTHGGEDSSKSPFSF